MSPEDGELRRFAERYGFEHEVLARGRSYRVENASANCPGLVEVLRLERLGRFGNIVFQLLNATLLARHLGCTTIEMFPFEGGPPPAIIDGLTFCYAPEENASSARRPTLVGHFYETYHFGTLIRDIPAREIWVVIKHVMHPLFRQIRNNPTRLSPQTLVIHFRSGDVFGAPPVHPLYVQPPASYYEMAIRHTLDSMGVRNVVLVFEDRANPAIAVTERFLQSYGVPFRAQSSHFVDDLACLLGAHHLVASFGTLCEAVALLSAKLQTFVAFRVLDAQEHLHGRARSLFPALLNQRGATTLLVEDVDGGYIPRLDWRRSPDQLDLMVNYPIEHLALRAGPFFSSWQGPQYVLG